MNDLLFIGAAGLTIKIKHSLIYSFENYVKV